MKASGTVVNGTVILDEGASFANGSRVDVELVQQFEYPHPLAPYDRDKEMALLRERIAESEAGSPDLSLEEVFAKIDAEILDR